MTSRAIQGTLYVAAVVTAAAGAGCGGTGPTASSPAPGRRAAVDVVPLTTAQAARAADRIALVISRGSRVVAGAPGTPFTRTKFAVQEVLKGDLPRQFVVQVIGGHLGNVSVESPVPAFVPSQRYILFLGPDNRAGPTVFPQAIFAVKRIRNAETVEPTPRGLQLRSAHLGDVLDSIRRYLQSTRGGP